MTKIYVLKLQNGKYYVGKTDDVKKRYNQHLNGSGSEWTRTYKPIAIEKVIENASPFDEDKITKEYMLEYGIDNVRGGSYVQMELNDTYKKTLNTEIRNAKNLCIKCGKEGHFAKNCYIKTESKQETSEEDEWECEKCSRSFTTYYGAMVHERSCKTKQNKTTYVEEYDELPVTYYNKPTYSYTYTYVNQNDTCYRCGRTGHYASNCYASRHFKGYDLD